MTSNPAGAAASRFIKTAWRAGDVEVEPLPGGGNNRVFRVISDDGDALLKAYFSHPDDRRDRLGAEFGLTSFAWAHGVRQVPEPYGQDPEHRLALYEFIRGRRLRPDELDAAAVEIGRAHV